MSVCILHSTSNEIVCILYGNYIAVFHSIQHHAHLLAYKATMPVSNGLIHMIVYSQYCNYDIVCRSTKPHDYLKALPQLRQRFPFDSTTRMFACFVVAKTPFQSAQPHDCLRVLVQLRNSFLFSPTTRLFACFTVTTTPLSIRPNQLGVSRLTVWCSNQRVTVPHSQ